MLFENNRDHLNDFVRLNETWIAAHFSLEDIDRELAARPEQVLDDGGYIFSLLSDDQVVGVCALFRDTNERYELARMAVDPAHQGRGHGHTLMRACLDKLASLNAVTVYLVSNTKLEAAIELYRKYGFETTHTGPHPQYARANIVMERHV